MNPRSKKFIKANEENKSRTGSRSFKVLDWGKPSITVAYGHREVHVHPNGHRRLSVYEGMLLQGFPERYVLEGTLSDQIEQVSEAVPPRMAFAVAQSIRTLLRISNITDPQAIDEQAHIEVIKTAVS